jgi:hypothetical protein
MQPLARPSAQVDLPQPLNYRHQHDQILSRLARPAAIKNESLLDDVYFAETEDSKNKRNSLIRCSFDAVVSPWGGKLNSEEHIKDCITAKLLFVFSLTPDLGGSSSANCSLLAYLNYLTFLRWRNNNGIRRTSDLTDVWFEKYLEDLQEAGLEGLVPVSDRTDALLSEISAGLRPWPIRGSDGARIDWTAFAHSVGIESAGWFAKTFQGRVLRSLKQSDPALYAKVLGRRTSIYADLPEADEGEKPEKLTENRLASLLIPTCIDHDPRAHLRRPMVMIRHG